VKWTLYGKRSSERDPGLNVTKLNLILEKYSVHCEMDLCM